MSIKVPGSPNMPPVSAKTAFRDAYLANQAANSQHDLFPHVDKSYLEWFTQYTDVLKYKNSIATICLSGETDTALTRLNKIASAGFKQVEIMVQDTDEFAPEVIYQRCLELGLTVSAYQPFRNFEGEEDQIDVKLDELREFIRKADALHTDLLLMCATCEETSSSDIDLHIKHLRLAADEAAKYNKKIAYESLAWSKHITNLEELCDVILKVDRPNFGICLDSFHIFTKRSSLDVLDAMKGKIFFVQLCDAPLLKINDLLTYSRNYRTYPMQGELDNLLLLEKIDQVGYNGPLSLEIFNSYFKKADKQILADDAFRSIVCLQLKSQHMLPPPPKIKGVLLPDITSVITPSHLSNIDVVVSGKQQYMNRVNLFHYYSNSISLIEGDAENSPYTMKKRLNVLCKDRVEFNRITLYFYCVLGFKVLKKDPENIFNEFGLSLNLTFGTDDDDLKIAIATTDA